MNRFFSLVLFFPLVFALILFLSLGRYFSLHLNEMAEVRVMDAANSASDAAMLFAQRTSHVGAYGRTTIDPEEIWTEYKRIFLKALDLYSDRNMDLMEGYCPATVLAVNDGYFVRMRTHVGTPANQPGYRWSQKIPYARKVGDELVADTMNGTSVLSYNLNPSTGGGTAFVWGEDVPLLSTPGGRHDVSAIAKEILTAVDYCIEVENSAVSSNLWDKQAFYVPKQLLDTMYYDAVDFKGMSLVNLLQGFDLISSKPVDYYTISNTQMVESAQYVCLDVNGQQYYLPEVALERVYPTTPYVVRNLVANKIVAAKLGYYPDPKYYE